MQGIFELTSEAIPLFFVLVIVHELKKGDEEMKEFIPSIVMLSAIEIPAMVVTILCMITHNQNSELFHMVTVICFALIGLIYLKR